MTAVPETKPSFWDNWCAATSPVPTTPRIRHDRGGNSQCLCALVFGNGPENFLKKAFFFLHFRKWKFTMPVYFSFWKWQENFLKKALFLHFQKWKFTMIICFSFWKRVWDFLKKRHDFTFSKMEIQNACILWKWAGESFKKRALFYIVENGNSQCLYALVFENGPENLKKRHFFTFSKMEIHNACIL